MNQSDRISFKRCVGLLHHFGNRQFRVPTYLPLSQTSVSDGRETPHHSRPFSVLVLQFSPAATAIHPPSRQSRSHPPTHSPKPARVSSLHPSRLQSRSHSHPPTQSPVPQQPTHPLAKARVSSLHPSRLSLTAIARGSRLSLSRLSLAACVSLSHGCRSRLESLLDGRRSHLSLTQSWRQRQRLSHSPQQISLLPHFAANSHHCLFSSSPSERRNPAIILIEAAAGRRCRNSQQKVEEGHFKRSGVCVGVCVGMWEDHTTGLEDSGKKPLKSHMEGFEDGDVKSKKRKRNLCTVADDECHVMTLENFYKRTILALTKPSYLLGLGFNHVRPENRVRLCHFLQKLVRQHNWMEASGVLSLLLKGTCKDNDPTMNRFKYLVSMEFLKHAENDDINLTTISGIFDTWMTRIGINLANKRKTSEYMKEDLFIVRLESILIHFMHGNIEGERQNARSLMREHGFEGHPMLHMIIGLIFYQLWYSSIPEDMQWKGSDQIYTPSNSNISASPSYSDMSFTRVRYDAGGSEGHNALFSCESESSFQFDSETSVMNDKRMLVEAESDFHKEVVPMEVEVNPHSNPQQDFQPPGFYANSAENEPSIDNDGFHMHSFPNLFALKSLESWLLPLQTKNWELERVIQDDEYENAVKYLREAVYSKPPVMSAFLPFVQLLLIGGNVKEALHELEMFGGYSNASLPTRLRACLLERVDPTDSLTLSTCFEDSLKSDPTCSESLAKLISLHQNEYNTWREFASCFLKVCQYEEDHMSVCLHGNEGGKKQGYSVHYNRIPKLFMQGRSGKAWRIRCRWWLARHFSKNLLASEMAAGDVELLTYKAACASHMYGSHFDYVVEAYTCLEKRNNRDLLMLLQIHMQNSIGLNLYFQRRTN
ncbi:uncharacterized protein LOC110601133 isoform X2 [Manihot esculenta]|uniref:uncharacterized protein LOC110601133 isoform X2 n=1 Tax=Manihot esculenta TaxID=3983 RepID=UPI001CC5FBC2|nr:uncharacterized protein LOC110601133 isoform X2 [Manihot esculenta]